MPKVEKPKKKATTTQNSRTHAENQERAYIAASRRSDRSLEARCESARRASEIHKHRTGRALNVTEDAVAGEDMYEEVEDDLPTMQRRLAAHMESNRLHFNHRLQSYMATQFAQRSAFARQMQDPQPQRPAPYAIPQFRPSQLAGAPQPQLGMPQQQFHPQMHQAPPSGPRSNHMPPPPHQVGMSSQQPGFQFVPYNPAQQFGQPAPQSQPFSHAPQLNQPPQYMQPQHQPQQMAMAHPQQVHGLPTAPQPYPPRQPMCGQSYIQAQSYLQSRQASVASNVDPNINAPAGHELSNRFQRLNLKKEPSATQSPSLANLPSAGPSPALKQGTPAASPVEFKQPHSSYNAHNANSDPLSMSLPLAAQQIAAGMQSGMRMPQPQQPQQQQKAPHGTQNVTPQQQNTNSPNLHVALTHEPTVQPTIESPQYKALHNLQPVPTHEPSASSSPAKTTPEQQQRQVMTADGAAADSSTVFGFNMDDVDLSAFMDNAPAFGSDDEFNMNFSEQYNEDLFAQFTNGEDFNPAMFEGA